MLLSRYGEGARFVLDLDFETGTALIVKALEKKAEETLYQRWLIGGYEKTMNFNDMKKSLVPTSKKESLTEDEIYRKVMNITEMVVTR